MTREEALAQVPIITDQLTSVLTNGFPLVEQLSFAEKSKEAYLVLNDPSLLEMPIDDMIEHIPTLLGEAGTTGEPLPELAEKIRQKGFKLKKISGAVTGYKRNAIKALSELPDNADFEAELNALMSDAGAALQEALA